MIAGIGCAPQAELRRQDLKVQLTVQSGYVGVVLCGFGSTDKANSAILNGGLTRLVLQLPCLLRRARHRWRRVDKV